MNNGAFLGVHIAFTYAEKTYIGYVPSYPYCGL